MGILVLPLLSLTQETPVYVSSGSSYANLTPSDRRPISPSYQHDGIRNFRTSEFAEAWEVRRPKQFSKNTKNKSSKKCKFFIFCAYTASRYSPAFINSVSVIGLRPLWSVTVCLRQKRWHSKTQTLFSMKEGTMRFPTLKDIPKPTTTHFSTKNSSSLFSACSCRTPWPPSIFLRCSVSELERIRARSSAIRVWFRRRPRQKGLKKPEKTSTKLKVRIKVLLVVEGVIGVPNKR